ncbi:MAG: hypothetical protein VX899_12780 [Myxococcota bacterium]|nr:hypothetical protein [Myxococcota bacterium]
MNLPTDSLHPRIKLARSSAPASPKDLLQTRQFFGSVGLQLPEDVAVLFHYATELEFLVDKVDYLRIWSPSGILELNDAHALQAYMNAVAIADNGGSGVLVFAEAQDGSGLYMTSFADPDPDELVFVSESLTALLRDGVGLDAVVAP